MLQIPYRQVERGLLPRTLERMYHSYAFTNVDTGGGFAYDDLNQWADGTQQLMLHSMKWAGRLAHTDRALAEQEVEFIEKLGVNWRLRGFGTVVPHTAEELSCLNKEQGDALRPYFRRRRTYYLDTLKQIGAAGVAAIAASALIRLDKGKGSPLWIPGTDPAGGIMLRAVARACRTAREIKREAERWAKGRPPLVQTSYIRIQAARGAVAGWRVGPGGILIPDELPGRPKVRRIAAISFLINHLWVPYAEVLRTIMSMTPNGQHAGSIDPVIEEAKKWSQYTALDLKSYDTTVAYETHVALREELWLPVIEWIYANVPDPLRRTLFPPAEMAAVDQMIITMPVLTPPRDPRYGAEVWPSVGQTRSGENPTSFKGTEVRRAHCEAKAAHLGFPKDSFFIFNYGDDTLMMSNSVSHAKAWNEEPSFLGLNEVPAPDSTFLMKRVPQGYGYVGRMLSASINREMSHEPSTVIAAAAAFATRDLLLTGHPARASYYEGLRAYGGPARMQRAVEVAASVSRQVSSLQPVLALNQLAGRVAESHHGSQRSDIASAIRLLATLSGVSQSDKQSVMLAADEVDIGQHGQTHALPWLEFDNAASAIPESVVHQHLIGYAHGYRRPDEPEDTSPKKNS